MAWRFLNKLKYLGLISRTGKMKMKQKKKQTNLKG